MRVITIIYKESEITEDLKIDKAETFIKFYTNSIEGSLERIVDVCLSYGCLINSENTDAYDISIISENLALKVFMEGWCRKEISDKNIKLETPSVVIDEEFENQNDLVYLPTSPKYTVHNRYTNLLYEIMASKYLENIKINDVLNNINRKKYGYQ